MQAAGKQEQKNVFRRRVAASLLGLGVLALAGCRQDMQDQPKFYPQRSTTFFPDGRSVRPQVTGTVARGQEDAGSYFRTGLINGQEGEGLPVPLTHDLLLRGQEKYNVYCTACHSRVGNGKGMIVMRGYFPAGNLNTDHVRQATLGHLYNVIANGYGAMPEYGTQVDAADRWAIVAYIRALELSQHATAADAGGAHVETMAEVEQREGFAPDFVKEWGLPLTATQVQQAAPATNAPKPTPAGSLSIPNTAATPRGVTNAQPSAPAVNTAPITPAAKSAAQAAGKPVASLEGSATTPVSTAPKATVAEVASGEKLYQANCSPCHQATRQGMPPMIPSLVGIVGRVGAAHIHSVVASGIMTGKVNMPSFAGKLTPGDVDKIVAYLAASK